MHILKITGKVLATLLLFTAAAGVSVYLGGG
jgi:hypothetical protein